MTFDDLTLDEFVQLGLAQLADYLEKWAAFWDGFGAGDALGV